MEELFGGEEVEGVGFLGCCVSYLVRYCRLYKLQVRDYGYNDCFWKPYQTCKSVKLFLAYSSRLRDCIKKFVPFPVFNVNKNPIT